MPSFGLRTSHINTMEDPKNIKDPKKENESPELNDEVLKAIQGGMTWKQFVGNQDNLGLEEEATAHHQGVWEGP